MNFFAELCVYARAYVVVRFSIYSFFYVSNSFDKFVADLFVFLEL